MNNFFSSINWFFFRPPLSTRSIIPINVTQTIMIVACVRLFMFTLLVSANHEIINR